MSSLPDALNVIFTETYYWITVVMMFLIHVGFCTYEVGVARRKNAMTVVMKNTMLIPLVTVTFFFFGWWVYFAFSNVPFNGGFIDAPYALPWGELMGGPHMGGGADANAPVWARLNGVFWAAFLLFSWTTASIISGAVMERIRTGAFFIFAVLVGSFTWILDASWGWNPAGWMVQIMGYHDAYASGVVHAIAGGSALAIIIVLGPRIGKFGPSGEVRRILPHNPWLVTIGLFLIFTGFWGFYAACNIPIFDVDTTDGVFYSATNIYLMPTTLSGITFNFILSLSGGLMATYVVSRGDPFWTYSGGLCGIISASAGNDLYHPIIAFGVGAIGAGSAYYVNNILERRFKIDDPVGAVAVHGWGGFFGTVIAGFILWGYPAANPTSEGAAWFATADGAPMINPLGNIIGAIIMFWILGFVPCYLVARLLKHFNMLRVPREVELAGFDTAKYGDPYPYFPKSDTEFDAIEREHAKGKH